jgi:2-haloacid dehalogenase
MPSSSEPTIDAVIFDIGGVLLDWNPRYLYRQLFDDEEKMERFLAEIATMKWHEANDRGVPFAVTCRELAARHPEYAEQIWAWGQRSEEMIGGPIAGTVEILGELRRRRVRCYALTNMEAETYPQRLARYEFMRWFDGSVVSSAEGIIKPDPEIFERLIARFGLAPETTLFVDDSARNIAAAAALGLQTERFSSPAALRRRLEAAGLLDGRR